MVPQKNIVLREVLAKERRRLLSAFQTPDNFFFKLSIWKCSELQETVSSQEGCSAVSLYFPRKVTWRKLHFTHIGSSAFCGWSFCLTLSKGGTPNSHSQLNLGRQGRGEERRRWAHITQPTAGSLLPPQGNTPSSFNPRWLTRTFKFNISFLTWGTER